MIGERGKMERRAGKKRIRKDENAESKNEEGRKREDGRREGKRASPQLNENDPSALWLVFRDLSFLVTTDG